MYRSHQTIITNEQESLLITEEQNVKITSEK